MPRIKKDEDKEEDVRVERTNEDGDKSEINKLKKKLKKCLAERQEYLNGWQRAQADFINARKEHESARKESDAFVKKDVFSRIIPVVDSFEMAFKDRKAWEQIDKNWRSGIEYIYKQLLDTMKEGGLSLIDPLGEKFNPQLHESVELIKVNKKEKDGEIVEVMQKGYKINEKIIRPARVKVAEFKPNSSN